MKKIWLITYNLDGVTAGPSVRFQRYAPFFVDKGYRLVFVTFKSNPNLPNNESREFYDVIRVSSKFPVFHHTLFIAKCLLKAIFSKEKPFSILTFSLTTFHLWFLPILNWQNLKLIFVNTMSLHTTYLKGSSFPVKLYNSLHSKLYSLLFRNLHAIVNSSNALTDGFRKLNVPETKLKVIYNGVNNQRFKPVDEADKQSFREKLDLPKNGKIVLFVGLKVDRKGILDLMESWKLIYKDHTDYYLVLVGDEKTSAGDPDYNSQWDLIKKEIEDPELRVINRPNHPQIEEYFFSSDIFIFLSKKEGMPNVVLEAMAAGLPIIITEFEGFSDDYGENGENYLLVERNSQIISQAIVKLNTDQDLHKKIRNNSLDRVQEHFLVEASIDKYIQLFESKIQMHLGFHYHLPAFKENGKIYTMAFQGLFIDGLAEHCDKITLFLFTPTKAEKKELDYAIRSPKVELVSLMKHYKIPVRILLYPTIRKQIQTMINSLDLILMRAPTPLLPLITKDIKGKIPYAYLVVGEMSMHVDSIKQKEWRKSLIRHYVNWNESKQENYAKDALIFANSKVTFDKYKTLSDNCVEVKTTTLKKEDFYIREDTCFNSICEILFTGRIEQEKGILEITEAIGKLHKENIDCRLNIVGWILPKDPIEGLIRKIAAEYGIEDKIIFHGFKTAGEELFDLYKKADLFVVASQHNEGFPRTIWEALAHSVPVICTPVGSISQVLTNEHDALFIKPKSSESIKENIRKLILDSALRKRMIKNGLETVKEVTQEIQSKKMMDAIKTYIRH